MDHLRRVWPVIAATSLGLISIAEAPAQPYPSRPVMLVSPFGAGGGTDVLCRVIAEKLRGMLGQQFIVENRTGGGGNIGTEYVARAAPDGHTLLCAPDPVFSSHLLYSKLRFDPRAFEPVSIFARFATVVASRPNLPIADLADLMAYARAHPGKLNWASPGTGQTSHLLLEAIKAKANIDIVHIPYRSGAEALNDVLAGQVDLVAPTLTIGLPYIRAGAVKLLAAASRKRLAAFPEVAALNEAIPGVEADVWVAIAAPPATPKFIANRLSDAIAKVVGTPEVKARFAELETETMATRPEQMQQLAQETSQRWGRIIAAAKIKLD